MSQHVACRFVSYWFATFVLSVTDLAISVMSLTRQLRQRVVISSNALIGFATIQVLSQWINTIIKYLLLVIEASRTRTSVWVARDVSREFIHLLP